VPRKGIGSCRIPLIVKIAIVAVMLVFAARSRQLVRWLWPSHVDEEPQRELVVAGGSDDALSGRDTLDAGVDGDEDGTDWEAEEAAELRRLRCSVFGEVLGAVAVRAPAARAASAVRAAAAAIFARVPPRHTWQMASASASAASAGRGGASSRSSRVTMAVTCALSA